MTPLAKSKTKPKRRPTSWEFEAIGTHWWIGLLEPVPVQRLKSLRQRVDERIERFDKTYSRFRGDSLVTRIAAHAGTYVFPSDSEALFRLYRQLYDTTGGAVTPFIGDLLVAAGYDASYSFQPKRLQPPSVWDEAMEYRDGTLMTRHPVTLDFGAAGKGYLVDIVAGLLKEDGIDAFCVDAGGDMFVCGTKTLRVGLEDPDDPKQVIGAAQLRNQAIAGSAPNRRKWAQYHHVMDPFALRSTTGLKAAWVVSGSGLLADGLATALFFVIPEKLKQFDFEYLLINDKNQYRKSAGFPAELF